MCARGAAVYKTERRASRERRTEGGGRRREERARGLASDCRRGRDGRTCAVKEEEEEEKNGREATTGVAFNLRLLNLVIRLLKSIS